MDVLISTMVATIHIDDKLCWIENTYHKYECNHNPQHSPKDVATNKIELLIPKFCGLHSVVQCVNHVNSTNFEVGYKNLLEFIDG